MKFKQLIDNLIPERFYKPIYNSFTFSLSKPILFYETKLQNWLKGTNTVDSADNYDLTKMNIAVLENYYLKKLTYLDSFVGCEERIKYNGTGLILDKILNTVFDSIDNRIYCETVINKNNFISYENNGSISYQNNSTEYSYNTPTIAIADIVINVPNDLSSKQNEILNYSKKFTSTGLKTIINLI